MRSKEQLITQLTQIADMYDQAKNPAGNDVRALIAELENGKADHTKITIEAGITVDKFDGDDISKDPVETIHFTQDI